MGADTPKPKQAGMTLAQAKHAKRDVIARRVEDSAKVIAYQHDQKRKNNPDVGVVTPDNDPEQPRTRWAYVRTSTRLCSSTSDVRRSSNSSTPPWQPVLKMPSKRKARSSLGSIMP